MQITPLAAVDEGLSEAAALAVAFAVGLADATAVALIEAIEVGEAVAVTVEVGVADVAAGMVMMAAVMQSGITGVWSLLTSSTEKIWVPDITFVQVNKVPAVSATVPFWVKARTPGAVGTVVPTK